MRGNKTGPIIRKSNITAPTQRPDINVVEYMNECVSFLIIGNDGGIGDEDLVGVVVGEIGASDEDMGDPDG
jgi:hypothetical protein